MVSKNAKKVSRTAIQKIADEYGLRIVDAKKHLDVILTPRDIKNSSMKSPSSCAFAKACRNKDDVTAAYFFLTVAYLQYENRIERYVLPPSIQAEIKSFDRGGPKAMEAGHYRLSPIQKAKRLGAKQSVSTKTGTGKKKHYHRSDNVRRAVI